MHRTCSRATSRRSAKATPWSAASGRFQPKPDAEHHPAAAQVVERGHLLGQHDRVVLGDQHHPGAEGDPLGGRGRGGQGHERVEAAAVVVELDALDQSRRRVVADRQVGVLGQVERGEPPLLGRPGQGGRGHGPVGEEGGDARGARSSAPQAGGQRRPRVGGGVGEQGGEGRLLAGPGGADGRPAGPAIIGA